MAGVTLMALGCLWWHAWFPVDGVVAAAIGVASVALGDIGLHFVWQAWAFTLRGRRGTYGTGLPLVNQSTWTDAHTCSKTTGSSRRFNCMQSRLLSRISRLRLLLVNTRFDC